MQPSMSEDQYLQLMLRYNLAMEELARLDALGEFTNRFGIQVDGCQHLETLCTTVANRCTWPEEAAVIVSSYLADAWVLNVDYAKVVGVQLDGMPTFPQSYGSFEIGRWQQVRENPKKLSDLLSERIGICLSYSFALGIVLRVTELAETVWLGTYVTENIGHMVVLAEGPRRQFDLSHRAHTGQLGFPKVEIVSQFNLLPEEIFSLPSS